MSENIVYTHIKIPDCSFCTKAKELLDKHNKEYIVQEVGTDLTPRDLYQKIGGYRTFPQIIFEGNHLKNGYPDLEHILGEAPIS